MKKPNISDVVLLKYGDIGTKLGRVEKYCKDENKFKVQLFYSPSAKCNNLEPATKNLNIRTINDVIENFGCYPIVSRDCPGLINKIRQFKKTIKTMNAE